jgi:hypothetical protein
VSIPSDRPESTSASCPVCCPISTRVIRARPSWTTYTDHCPCSRNSALVGNLEHVFGCPVDDPHFHPVGVAQRRKGLGGVDDVEDDVHALFLYARRTIGTMKARSGRLTESAAFSREQPFGGRATGGPPPMDVPSMAKGSDTRRR